MGCGSSAHVIAKPGDSLAKLPQVPVETDSSETQEQEEVLKDLPKVVEKVMDGLKETDTEVLANHSNVADTPKVIDKITADSPIVDNFKPNDMNQDTDSDGSPQVVLQGILLPDNISIASFTHEDLHDLHLGEHGLSLGNISPTHSADKDSLRTSSPDSEIEEALANTIDANPPTPKPTFSELKQLAMIPLNAIHMFDPSPKPEEEELIVVEEVVEKVSNILPEPKRDVQIILKEPTDWEKQADLIANTRKYNPIEAMRKFRKDNNSRSSSSLPHGRSFRPKPQRPFEEDLSELFHDHQSPVRGRLSSAKSERGTKGDLIEADSNGYGALDTEKDTPSPHIKVPEVKIQKSSAKRKSNNTLTVTQNGGRSVPSPSLYKVRERCAVCSKKNKH